MQGIDLSGMGTWRVARIPVTRNIGIVSINIIVTLQMEAMPRQKRLRRVQVSKLMDPVAPAPCKMRGKALKSALL